ncbi:MAG: sulfite exporter TauE/SafE family protein [Cytophagales bacterium]|nr:sulfite exporter TauE/SafE family protein [Cytophagales bacterium]
MADFEIKWIFLLVLPAVAFLYASVGHGGASGYLALMALFSFSPEIMKPTALVLNLFVAGAAFYHYYKEGYFNKKLFLCFAASSVPMAFLGGMLEINASLYKQILGVLLTFAILKMLNVFKSKERKIRDVKTGQGLLVGAGIGFFSGLIGIGGGIILSPVILLLHWGKAKEAAAVSALFIWVNSASGLVGQISSGVALSQQAFLLVGVALTGGFFGGYLGSRKLNNAHVRYLLAFVLMLASFKLFVI